MHAPAPEAAEACILQCLNFLLCWTAGPLIPTQIQDSPDLPMHPAKELFEATNGNFNFFVNLEFKKHYLYSLPKPDGNIAKEKTLIQDSTVHKPLETI